MHYILSCTKDECSLNPSMKCRGSFNWVRLPCHPYPSQIQESSESIRYLECIILDSVELGAGQFDEPQQPVGTGGFPSVTERVCTGMYITPDPRDRTTLLTVQAF